MTKNSLVEELWILSSDQGGWIYAAAAKRIEELEEALRKIAQKDLQAIAIDALERGKHGASTRIRHNDK